MLFVPHVFMFFFLRWYVFFSACFRCIDCFFFLLVCFRTLLSFKKIVSVCLFVCLSESPYKPYLKDLSMEVTTELMCRLDNDPLAKKWFYESFGLPATCTKSDVLGNISELFPDIPIKLLKDVFQALELHDLVEILEKVLKPRMLRPTLPLKEIKKQ